MAVVRGSIGWLPGGLWNQRIHPGEPGAHMTVYSPLGPINSGGLERAGSRNDFLGHSAEMWQPMHDEEARFFTLRVEGGMTASLSAPSLGPERRPPQPSVVVA